MQGSSCTAFAVLAVKGGTLLYPSPPGAVNSKQGTELWLAFSPAKQVNLFLRVMRKREDGYHDLASLFHVGCAFPLLFEAREVGEGQCAPEAMMRCR